mmetsp:Transcript_13092/g.52433  ORF Transcript_13092/g.52433 Transcript_13092/m.52433 type:complete len:163 (-) Transcript_13092:38-526(-)
MRTLVNATPAMRRASYWGGDIVRPLTAALDAAFGEPQRVGFGSFDLALQTLWPVDIVIVRDVLFHFSPERGLDVLRRVDASGARFLLTTYFPGEDNAKSRHRFDGGGHGFASFWHLNLLDPPFSLPPPLLNIGFDGRAGPEYRTRVMGLWRLPLFPGGAVGA